MKRIIVVYVCPIVACIAAVICILGILAIHENTVTVQETLPAPQVFQGEMAQIVILSLTARQFTTHTSTDYCLRLNEAKTSAVRSLEHQGYKVVEEIPLYMGTRNFPSGFFFRYEQQ